MRKFLSTKAGATFNTSSPNFTIAVRKDGIELVIKAKKGVYSIINMVYVGDDCLLLYADWGNYFSYLNNPDVQMPRIKKNCPTLYGCLTTDEGICQMELSDDTTIIGELIRISEVKPMFCYIDQKIIDTAFDIFNTCNKIYSEIYHNPPFPAWKDRLKDLWE